MGIDDIHRKMLAGDMAQQEDASPEVVCPFCHSHETELVSLFGGQLSTDQYYCRACRSYFERFTRDDEAGDAR